MAERQYSDDEVARIFERASETEPSALPAAAGGKGLTLAALQDIGREVGISPESIALAARSLDHAGLPASLRLIGLPIGVGRTVELDRSLSEPEWEALVADLRTTFAARGAVRYDGPFRQWTNGNLQALVEPTPTGHRLRIQTVHGASRAMMTAGGVVMGGAAVTLLAITLTGGLGHPGTALNVGTLALAGLGLFAAGAARVPGWARRRRAQIEAVIARLTGSAATPPKASPDA
jgi:hypothetical protein